MENIFRNLQKTNLKNIKYYSKTINIIQIKIYKIQYNKLFQLKKYKFIKNIYN